MRIAGILFLLLLSLTGEARQFHIRNFSVGDGLPQSQVFAIEQDQSGMIWLATRGGGLSSFNGKIFQNFSTRDGLLNDFLFDLKWNNEQLFIATNIGLSIYDKGKFHNHRMEKEGKTISISSLSISPDGKVYMATSSGVWFWNNGELTDVFSQLSIPSRSVSVLMVESEKKIWFGDDYGLHLLEVLSDGRFRVFNFGSSNGLRNSSVRVILSQPDNSLLIGTYGGGIWEFRDKRFTPSFMNKAMETGIVLSLFRDDENIWVGTYDKGVYRFQLRDSSVTQLSRREGLANDHIACINKDRWGSVWIGTSGGGVSQYLGDHFIHFNERNGFPGNYVYAVAVGEDSSIWLGTDAKGVVKMKNNSYTLLNADSGFVNEKVKAIEIASDGSVWLGTEGKGLWNYFQGRWERLTHREGLSSNWIKEIKEDDSSGIWVATASGGVNYIQLREGGYSIRVIDESKGLPRNRVNTILPLKDRLVIGMEGGGIAFLLHDGQWIYLDQKDGLSSMVIRAMRLDKNGRLWIATGGGGLISLNPQSPQKEIMVYKKEQGLFSDNLYLIEYDGKDLWVGSESGIDQIMLAETSQIKEIRHYGKAEGFVGVETNQNATSIGPGKRIWFGTVNGLTMLDAERTKRNTLPPVLSLSGIDLFYKPLAETRFSDHVLSRNNFEDGLLLEFNENHIGFQFIGIDIQNPDGVRYQWKLEGLEDDWSPWSVKSEVTYSNLSPGEYTFQVRAANGGGITTLEPLSYSFRILPAWYQTTLFKYSAGGFLLLVIGLLVLILIYRSRKKNRMIRERLEAEKKFVELEQQALRLQMNPHFIFHALNSIQNFVEKSDKETARSYLSKFSVLMRSILENSRDKKVTLDKEIETLRAYLQLEQFTRNHSFDFSFIFPDEMELELIEVPALLLQPFAENAIIHGFSGLKGRRPSLEIEFREEEDILICMIRDNGIGREEAGRSKMQLDALHRSTAILVNEERLALLDKSSGKKGSGIFIRDLKDGDGQALGTEVEIRIYIG